MKPTQQLIEALESARKDIECLTCFGNSSIDHQVTKACHQIDRIKHFVRTQLNETPKPLERLTSEEIAWIWLNAINSSDDLGPISVFANAIQDAMIKKLTGASDETK